jgi:hypothetical protein
MRVAPFAISTVIAVFAYRSAVLDDILFEQRFKQRIACNGC